MRRFRRQNLFEAIALPLMLLRPYRCQACDLRHYNFVFSKSGHPAYTAFGAVAPGGAEIFCPQASAVGDEAGGVESARARIIPIGSFNPKYGV